MNPEPPASDPETAPQPAPQQEPRSTVWPLLFALAPLFAYGTCAATGMADTDNGFVSTIGGLLLWGASLFAAVGGSVGGMMTASRKPQRYAVSAMIAAPLAAVGSLVLWFLNFLPHWSMTSGRAFRRGRRTHVPGVANRSDWVDP